MVSAEWFGVFSRLWRRLWRGKSRVSRLTIKVPSDIFRRYVRQSLLGRLAFSSRTDWRQRVGESLVDWHIGRFGHEAATKTLVSILRTLNVGRVSWEDLILTSRFAMAVGLFRVSYEFRLASWRALSQSSWKQESAASQFAKLKQTLYCGQIDVASQHLEKLQDSPSRRLAGSPLETVSWYIQCCLGRTIERRARVSNKVEALWGQAVRGQDVLIVGPGETRDLPELVPGYLVARVIGPGVYEWQDSSDIASNKTDAVYSIPGNVSPRAMHTYPALRNKLESYSFVNIKKTDVLLIENSRPVETFWQLFSFGHPQMIPLAVLDVLAHGGRPVVVGSDFFQSPVAYRASERRSPGGRVQDPNGSDGGEFDRSALLASHDVFENWSIVRNLVSAGLVRGDERFLNSCALSPGELFNHYDETLGKYRV